MVDQCHVQWQKPKIEKILFNQGSNFHSLTCSIVKIIFLIAANFSSEVIPRKVNLNLISQSPQRPKKYTLNWVDDTSKIWNNFWETFRVNFFGIQVKRILVAHIPFFYYLSLHALIFSATALIIQLLIDNQIQYNLKSASIGQGSSLLSLLSPKIFFTGRPPSMADTEVQWGTSYLS